MRYEKVKRILLEKYVERMTLLYLFIMQVEVLGVSLPWRSIFSHEESGASLIECLNGHSKEVNPFIAETNTNHLDATSTNHREASPFQSEPSANSFVDLLSGEVVFSDTISQPVAESVVHEGGDLLNFLDDFISEPVSQGNNNLGDVVRQSVSQENNNSKIVSSEGPSDNGSQEYIRLFKFLAGPHWVCILTNQL